MTVRQLIRWAGLWRELSRMLVQPGLLVTHLGFDVSVGERSTELTPRSQSSRTRAAAERRGFS